MNSYSTSTGMNPSPTTTAQYHDERRTQATATRPDPMFIPYHQFVTGLFVKPENDVPGLLMHAAVGLLGEVVELRFADSRENQQEELGDIEFYAQAYINHLPDAWEGEVKFNPVVPENLLAAYDGLLRHAADLHDLTKKHWIYQKPLVDMPILESLISFRTCLQVVYEILGLSRGETVVMNRKKLLKRYPSGYTDSAAQARADKA